VNVGNAASRKEEAKQWMLCECYVSGVDWGKGGREHGWGSCKSDESELYKKRPGMRVDRVDARRVDVRRVRA